MPYWVYFLSNPNRVLYVGMTSDLARRIAQHRSGVRGSFTSRYGIGTLVYVEEFSDVRDAAAREYEIKKWGRAKKRRLVERDNPEWRDLLNDV